VRTGLDGALNLTQALRRATSELLARPYSVPIVEPATGTRRGCPDLAETWFSSSRSGIPIQDG